MNLAIIIPALNEEQAIPVVIQELQKMPSHIPRLGSFLIIVADNGSTDQTAARARAAGAQVVAAPRRGYGSACQAGMAAVPAHTDAVVFVDGDHSIFAEDLSLLLQPLLDDQADFVLGERRAVDPDALTFPQRWGNALACGLMHQFYGHRFRDLGPFRAIRWDVLKNLRMRDPAFGWTIEMQIKALQRGLRVTEVPVRYRRRIGESKISGTFWGSIKAGRAILWTVLRYAYRS